jgi:PhoPQ-activated pathogenicity-related protein
MVSIARPQTRWMAILTLAALAAGCATTAPQTRRTALDRYVHQPDPHYAYELVHTIDGEGYTGHVLKMTSQKWLTEKEINHPIWWHWLTVVVPDVVRHDEALLFIGGGNMNNPPPTEVSGMLSQFAVLSQSVVAELRMIPNQPVIFADETRSRTEDGIIAYTWDRYMRTGDEKWPLRLPMTKSAVRAMDTIQSYLGSDAGGNHVINNFVVAGGSKRGWTTWTTAAVDPRVIAVAPIVIDMLNVVPSFIHHYRAYGFYAPAVADYVEMGIMDWSGSKEYQDLMAIVEPYEYRDRLTMPKFLINATGDQFFLPTSWQFYWDDLRGPKYLRYVPNAHHGVSEGTDATESLMAFYFAIINRQPLPRYDWWLEGDRLVARPIDQPTEVKLWQATNPTARDFRVDTIGRAWASSNLAPNDQGLYVAEIPAPPAGWTAFLIELTYPTAGPTPIKLTTGVHVVPDTLPFEAPPMYQRGTPAKLDIPPHWR